MTLKFLLKQNFYEEKRNLTVFHLKFMTASWAGQGGRHCGWENIAKDMLWEEFTPYRLFLGSPALPLWLRNWHRWLAASTNGWVHKNPLNYAWKICCFWKEMEKLRNNTCFVLYLIVARGRYTGTVIYLRYRIFLLLCISLDRAELQHWLPSAMTKEKVHSYKIFTHRRWNAINLMILIVGFHCLLFITLFRIETHSLPCKNFSQ